MKKHLESFNQAGENLNILITTMVPRTNTGGDQLSIQELGEFIGVMRGNQSAFVDLFHQAHSFLDSFFGNLGQQLEQFHNGLVVRNVPQYMNNPNALMVLMAPPNPNALIQAPPNPNALIQAPPNSNQAPQNSNQAPRKE